jgi:hypothetical protein
LLSLAFNLLNRQAVRELLKCIFLTDGFTAMKPTRSTRTLTLKAHWLEIWAIMAEAI